MVWLGDLRVCRRRRGSGILLPRGQGGQMVDKTMAELLTDVG